MCNQTDHKETCPYCHHVSPVKDFTEADNTYTLDCEHCSWHYCNEHDCPQCEAQADKIALRELGVSCRKEAFLKIAQLRLELSRISKGSPSVFSHLFVRKKLERIFMDYIHLTDTSFSKGAFYQIMLESVYVRYLNISASLRSGI